MPQNLSETGRVRESVCMVDVPSKFMAPEDSMRSAEPHSRGTAQPAFYPQISERSSFSENRVENGTPLLFSEEPSAAAAAGFQRRSHQDKTGQVETPAKQTLPSQSVQGLGLRVQLDRFDNVVELVRHVHGAVGKAGFTDTTTRQRFIE